jgi:hypothetical protein
VARADPYALTRVHARYLAEMLAHPTVYTQRNVEQLRFVPAGGHRWARTLQIQIPATASPSSSVMRVIPLGQYGRRRLADFAVSDADGARLNLLTRRQHGIALTKATLAKHFYTLPDANWEKLAGKPEARRAYEQLKMALYAHYTEVGDIDDARGVARAMTSRFAKLLDFVDISEQTARPKVEAFARDFVEVMDTTRYLCWIRAAPGEVVNVKATYTTVDARHKLGSGTVIDKLKTVRLGLGRHLGTRTHIWNDWFRQFGLAPINYEFSIPSHRHAGSYYFTFDPPVGTDVTYLDWESGNSLQSDEVDCSVRSAHIHNDDDYLSRKTNRGGAIRAHVRCAPSDHKLIVGTALLNAAFVILIAAGRVPGQSGSTAQSLLLAAPSIFVAYLARQQRHYYADAMRRQRGIMWGYLAISVTFLVTITFSRHEEALGSRGLGWFATVVTWVWGAASIGIAAWYLPLGGSYERITESLAKRALNKIDKDNSATVPWESYAATVSNYARRIFGFTAFCVVAMIAITAVVWHYPPLHKNAARSKTVVLKVPSDFLCPGCTLDLHMPAAGGSSSHSHAV